MPTRSSRVRATVVIATRNRVDDLQRAVASVAVQTEPVEVIVIDDGSTDGTGSMLRSRFPDVTLVTHEASAGCVVRRNEGARIAKGEFVFSLDDDAEFGSEDTVARTLTEFDDATVGAVAIPHVDTLTNHLVNAPAPDEQVWCIASFTGTAYAVRRDLFLQLGGFYEPMIHQGEEGDFCQRLLAAGYVTRLGSAAPILHHESPRRSFYRMEYHGRRNDVLQAWKHAPTRWVIPHLAATSFNGMRQAIKTRRPYAHLRGLLSGWMSIVSGRALREPVSEDAYKTYRRLKRCGPMRLVELRRFLPLTPETTHAR